MISQRQAARLIPYLIPLSDNPGVSALTNSAFNLAKVAPCMIANTPFDRGARDDGVIENGYGRWAQFIDDAKFREYAGCTQRCR